MKKIRCPKCSKLFERLDQVKINEAYTVMHEECSIRSVLPLIDEGLFKVIYNTYLKAEVH